MSRKSNAQIEREAFEKAQEIQRLSEEKAEKRVQELLPALMAGLVAQLSARGPVAMETAPAADGSPAPLGLNMAGIDALAHAITKSSDPQNRRRIVPPAELKKREEARAALMVKLLENHEAGVVPVYQVVKKTQLADIMIDPQWKDEASKQMRPQEITWAGVPNDAMLPVDDKAKEVHSLYCDSIGVKSGFVFAGVGPDGENKYVPVHQLPAPWVQSAGQIIRGRPVGDLPGLAATAPQPGGFVDPRRHGPAGVVAKTQRILGSVAEPAVITR